MKHQIKAHSSIQFQIRCEQRTEPLKWYLVVLTSAHWGTCASHSLWKCNGSQSGATSATAIGSPSALATPNTHSCGAVYGKPRHSDEQGVWQQRMVIATCAPKGEARANGDKCSTPIRPPKRLASGRTCLTHMQVVYLKCETKGPCYYGTKASLKCEHHPMVSTCRHDMVELRCTNAS